ncbi:MAG: hypothetical protein EOP50_06785 [Sphingobacteriales bacterium]|nr:MAG: hypothetical protein EOP50_06785 [Sphingobacteriales bacterium]
MNKYPLLENLLMSVMSVDVGLSADREEDALKASLLSIDFRTRLRKELESAFADPSISWIELLDNEKYSVFSADTEEEAKKYIEKRLWDKLSQ